METERPPYRTMREFASDERPRERLARHGPEVLSEAELVAIALGSGARGENVMDMARRILDELGGLAGLARAEAARLQSVRGLGPAKAAQLAAAIELGRRVQRIDPESRPLLDTPERVFALLGPRLAGRTREVLYALPLDTRGRLLGGLQPVNGGGVSGVGVRPAEVFREAILLDATSLIIAHNHPSGDPRPSPQDVSITRDLAHAGDVLDIELLDHVVIGQGAFFSLRREGKGFPKG